MLVVESTQKFNKRLHYFVIMHTIISLNYATNKEIWV